MTIFDPGPQEVSDYLNEINRLIISLNQRNSTSIPLVLTPFGASEMQLGLNAVVQATNSALGVSIPYFSGPQDTSALISMLNTLSILGGAPTFADGASGAPVATIQFPTLLSGYVKRAPWKVAGVDYAVGIPTAKTLQNITAAVGVVPGLSISSTLVRVDSTANVVIDGYDFTIGGYHLAFIGSPNGTVSNCKFGSGGTISTDSASAGLTVKYCIMNQSGDTTSSAFITTAGGGAVVLQYNYFENFNQHVLEYNDTSHTGNSVDYRFNLIYNGGAGATLQHLNYLQFGTNSDAVSVTAAFNTTYQPSVPISGGEGFQFYSGGTSSSVTGNFTNNTMIYSPNGDGVAHVAEAPSGGAGSSNAIHVNNNYIDKKGGTGYFYPDAQAGISNIYSSNWDMSTGAAITNTP